MDARYEKVRENGVVRNLAVLTAVGVNDEGKREVLGVSCALSEAEVHWRDFLQGLIERGLTGVKLIISDDHSGLKKARQGVLPGAMWQRCLFHLAQNAQAYAPNKSVKQEVGKLLRDIYNAPTRAEAGERLKKVVDLYESKAPRLSRWLEQNCEESFSFYAYPEEHWKRIRTNNVSERLNQEIKRRTRVARLFPSPESALRLVTAVVVEIHEEWVSGNKYLDVCCKQHINRQLNAVNST